RFSYHFFIAGYDIPVLGVHDKEIAIGAKTNGFETVQYRLDRYFYKHHMDAAFGTETFHHSAQGDGWPAGRRYNPSRLRLNPQHSSILFNYALDQVGFIDFQSSLL